MAWCMKSGLDDAGVKFKSIGFFEPSGDFNEVFMVDEDLFAAATLVNYLNGGNVDPARINAILVKAREGLGLEYE